MSNLVVALKFIETVLSTSLFSPQAQHPSLQAPESIQGFSAELLRDDLNYLIARWFVEAICPQTGSDNIQYPYVYEAVRNTLMQRFSNTSISELHKATAGLSRIICNHLSERLESRKNISVAEKFTLLSISEKRCQICGYSFADEAVEQFLGGSLVEKIRHSFYDFLKPTYRSPTDSQVEIDHKQPLSRGGANDLDNLQLLCGFCNRAKRDFTTVFDASVSGVALCHPRLGNIRLSSWFLVVRTLVGNHCHFCGRNASVTELTVTPVTVSREINPVNICVTCYECDPIKQYRYVPVPNQ